jgi:hypothetical protein
MFIDARHPYATTLRQVFEGPRLCQFQRPTQLEDVFAALYAANFLLVRGMRVIFTAQYAENAGLHSREEGVAGVHLEW